MSTRAVPARAGSRPHPPWSATPQGRASAAIATPCPNVRRSPSSFVPSGGIDQRGRAEPFQNIDQNPPAAGFFDDLMADHLLPRIVAALHENARPDLLDQLDGCILGENSDCIDRLQRGQYLGARALVLDRTALAFQSLHRGIAVQSD